MGWAAPAVGTAAAAGMAAVFGLLVGSFLNVLILRLPVMLERGWRNEALAMLDLPPETHEPFDLLRPRSRCGACGHPIGWWENIPVLSWLLLRGRCSACSTRISPRYPLVEIASAVLAALVIAQHGVSPWSAGLVVLAWGLLALAVIDFDTTLLPDGLTLPLLWLGLLLQAWLHPDRLPQAVAGAAIGYGSLWCVYQGFRLLTGKEGMGFGDFKLFAVLGAWFGPLALLPIIVLSALCGAVVGLSLQWSGVIERGRAIPFGPFLACAGVLNLFIGPRLLAWTLGGGAG